MMTIAARNSMFEKYCFAACPDHVIKSGRCDCYNRSFRSDENHVRLMEVIVYMDKDQRSSEVIWLASDLTKEKITEEVNKKFGPGCWHAYDIR